MNIDKIVGISIILTLGAAYGIYFWQKEIFEIGYLISADNIRLFNLSPEILDSPLSVNN